MSMRWDKSVFSAQKKCWRLTLVVSFNSSRRSSKRQHKRIRHWRNSRNEEMMQLLLWEASMIAAPPFKVKLIRTWKLCRCTTTTRRSWMDLGQRNNNKRKLRLEQENEQLNSNLKKMRQLRGKVWLIKVAAVPECKSSIQLCPTKNRLMTNSHTRVNYKNSSRMMMTKTTHCHSTTQMILWTSLEI